MRLRRHRHHRSKRGTVTASAPRKFVCTAPGGFCRPPLGTGEKRLPSVIIEEDSTLSLRKQRQRSSTVHSGSDQALRCAGLVPQCLQPGPESSLQSAGDDGL